MAIYCITFYGYKGCWKEVLLSILSITSFVNYNQKGFQELGDNKQRMTFVQTFFYQKWGTVVLSKLITRSRSIPLNKELCRYLLNPLYLWLVFTLNSFTLHINTRFDVLCLLYLLIGTEISNYVLDYGFYYSDTVY